MQYARRVQGWRFDFSQPFKPVTWTAIAAVWAGIALTIATQNHLYRLYLHQPASWLDNFRYPGVECLFWCFATPALLGLVRRFDLLSPQRPKRALVFVLAYGMLEPLHALYRTPLHSFVYPNMEPMTSGALFRAYLYGNLLNDVWVFSSIVAIAHLVLYYTRSAERERMLAQGHPCAANMFVGHMIRVAAGRYDYRLDTMILDARAA